MRTALFLILFVLITMLNAMLYANPVPPFPMPVHEKDVITQRWLEKPVLHSRLLDSMETLDAWEHHGAGSMALTEHHAKDGKASVHLRSNTFTDTPSPSGRPPAAVIALFKVSNEDWSASNRLSFWVYPDCPGFYAISMLVMLRNEGTLPVPDDYDRLGRNYILVKNNQWNHIVWEIDHLSRDRVTGVEFAYRMQGHEPGASEEVQFYLDQLELQTVEPDHHEGWDVAPGRIAYSHTGYALHADKKAFANGLNAPSFSVMDAKSQTAVLQKEIQHIRTPLGSYQVMDFTEYNKSGSYYLKAGDIQTPAFSIARDIWEETIVKTVNCFYCLRCGFAVPGIHGICHEDWFAEHDGKKISFNGGWHDAGDLSQGLRNTCEAAYSMLLLAEQMPPEKPLRQVLLEEAKWGIEWILKNRFGDGNRCRWGTMDFWTDNIVGTVDDMTTTSIVNDAYHNFHAVTVEAIAARLCKDADPVLAARCLRFAEEDWGFAMEQSQRRPRLETYGVGAAASLELYRTTQNPKYAQQAMAFADAIMACQQIKPTDWDVPLSGFFYTTPKQERIQHYAHIGEIQLPVVALADLCTLFPEHAKFTAWKQSIERYANYLKTIATYTEPYSMFPASIYSLAESNDAKYQEQVKNGIRLSDTMYLRRFPVWYDFRGNYGVMLSQTRALSACVRVLQDKTLWNLVQKQLQWVVGQNPFTQSTMFGEGHDYAPQYSATSGDIVGGLPVGIQTNRNFDAPFWPSDNCYNFKEIWVHPSSRWLAILADLEAVKNMEFLLEQ